MDYKQATEIIKHYDIPRTTVARLAGWHNSDLSAWLGGKLDVSDEKAERLSLWIADIAKMIQVMRDTLRIKVDLTDVENVRYLVQKINDAEMQMSLPMEPDPNVIPFPVAEIAEAHLRIKPIDTSAASAD